MQMVAIKPILQTKLERFAQMIDQSIEEIVNQAISQYLEYLSEQQLEFEIRAFERMHPYLKTHYLGKFVAIYQGQLIDADAEVEPLFLRLQNRFDDLTILIRQVTPLPEETYHFHGVQLESAI